MILCPLVVSASGMTKYVTNMHRAAIAVMKNTATHESSVNALESQKKLWMFKWTTAFEEEILFLKPASGKGIYWQVIIFRFFLSVSRTKCIGQKLNHFVKTIPGEEAKVSLWILWSPCTDICFLVDWDKLSQGVSGYSPNPAAETQIKLFRYDISHDTTPSSTQVIRTRFRRRAPIIVLGYCFLLIFTLNAQIIWGSKLCIKSKLCRSWYSCRWGVWKSLKFV